MADQKNGHGRRLDQHAHDYWIFDLDNTLYPSHCNLFEQMDKKMGGFIAELLDLSYEEARRVQKSYLHAHGTTLNGLMKEHNVDPNYFLDHVHDIDLSVIAPDPHLAEALQSLPGHRLIFTNGSERHVENVIAQLGISDCFDGIFDIASSGYVPKPNHATYEIFVKKFDVEPARAVMFEDMARNLVSPEKMGMSTVLVASHKDWLGDHPTEGSILDHNNHDHVHHYADDISDFLHAVLAEEEDYQES
ncbi:MAG: pyrimidine 5'-nucleotidase [Alphaproteobacteria bacterium]|nr:MAG: pyrimidine 5'-nucleotidase [Alphaproteobacteria bacterium]